MDLWERLKADGEATLRSLCAQQFAEGQRLEYKRKSGLKDEGLSRDDRRGLGESLSAMSNAEGGILLFGVIDEGQKDGADIAKEIESIPNLTSFRNCLESLATVYLSPPNIDLEFLPIQIGGDSDEGVVAIRIGQSDSRPHMSLAPTHQKYFLRVLASNQPMLDFQIRDMLRIKTSPVIKVGYQLRPGSVTGDIHQSSLVLTLTNEGSVSARKAYVVVRRRTGLHPTGPGSDSFKEFQLADVSSRGFQAGSESPLHPGQELPAVMLLAHVRRIGDEAHYRLNARSRDFVAWDQCDPIQIEVTIGAEDTPAREISFTIEQDELERMADNVVLRRKPYYGGRRF